ncbi:MAG: hypothetical protein KDH15_13070 [Rhodocyclaceae bacterium]|nr:hypothetical protein [Rhodocyclaceae bacterium]
MFSVYAVKLCAEEKERWYIDSYQSLEEAKHVANCYTCGTADYAYVKDTAGGTVFFIRRPDCDEELATRPQ